MIYVGIFMLAGLLAAIEVPGLIRQGHRRELAAVVAILFLGTAYALALAAKLPLPTISQMLQWLAGPLGRLE